MSEMELLREVGADAGNDQAELDAARAAALARLRVAIAKEEQATAGRTRRWSVPTIRRVALAGAAAAVIAVVAAGIALNALRPPAAVARLDRLAVVAETVQQLQPSGSEFVYTRSRSAVLAQEVGADGTAISFVVNQDVERWLNASGQLRIRQVYGAPRFFSPQDEAAYAAAGLDAVYGEGVVEDMLYEPAEVLETTLTFWSTEPQELQAQMLAELDRAGDPEVPQPARLLDQASTLLQAPGAAPELRAALLRVLADEEGVAIAADTTPAGEPGVAASVEYVLDGDTYRRMVLFDATTSRLVEHTLTALDDLPGGIPAGTVIRSRVNESSVRVPSSDLPPPTS